MTTPATFATKAQVTHGPPTRTATLAWAALILSVTLQRSLPSLPRRITTVTEAVGVLGCLLLLWRRRRAPDAEEGRLMLWMLAVPVAAVVLAGYRGEYGNMASPAVSGLALLAFGRLDRRTRGESAWRALALLVTASVLLGVVDHGLVEPNARSFLRIVFDGRLFGILQTPNVLGESALLLAMLSFTVKAGRWRVYGILIALLAILAASSQTAGIAVMFVLLVWAIWRTGGSTGLLLGIWTTLTGVTAWLAWSFMRPDRPLTSFSEIWSGATFSSRTNVWHVLLSYHVPFSGLGQNALNEIFLTNVIPGASGVGSAHDVGLDAYMRDGWIGVAALAVALLAILWFVVVKRRLLGVAALGGFLFEASFEVTPSHAPFYALFFTAIAAAGSTSGVGGTEVAVPDRVVTPIAAPATAGGPISFGGRFLRRGNSAG